MSQVTNLILTFSAQEHSEARVKEINAFFTDETDNGGLVSADDPKFTSKWYGGGKCLECEVLIGAFNYLREQEFRHHLDTAVQWYCPEEVQLFIMREDEPVFSVVLLTTHKSVHPGMAQKGT
jgi:hypothetical protein